MQTYTKKTRIENFLDYFFMKGAKLHPFRFILKYIISIGIYTRTKYIFQEASITYHQISFISLCIITFNRVQIHFRHGYLSPLSLYLTLKAAFLMSFLQKAEQTLAISNIFLYLCKCSYAWMNSPFRTTECAFQTTECTFRSTERRFASLERRLNTYSMKITLARKTKDQQLHLSTKTVEKLLERIAKDDAKETITKFRHHLLLFDNSFIETENMKTWLHIYPAAEFEKDANDNLVLKQNNGILLLTFENFTKEEDITEAKNAASILPSTFAAIEGANANSLHVWVRYADKQGSLPASENDSEILYQAAYQQIMPLYQTLIHKEVDGSIPSLHDNFLMTLDATPYYNSKAVPIKVNAVFCKLHQHSAFIQAEKPKAPKQEEKQAPNKTNASIKDSISMMMDFLNNKYKLRYNSVMKYTEYQDKERTWLGFMPVSPRVQKRMTLEVQLADIRVSIKDVRNYLESDYIKSYDPIDEYLFACDGKWDGKDHIRALARTVPTNNPRWADWFYTWFLGMVEQWRTYRIHQYGNSVVPLLISKQGYNKSTFCRRLLPQELQWGYNDNLILSEKRQVLQAMSQFMLINLDEFNQISATVQQGFLKNIIQLPTVKIKRPYGSHVEEFPRTASFIATSNVDDILSDPSGSRRFIGIKLTGPIDVSVKPNHKQLFAQALAALHNGEKCYFDDIQTKLLMDSNKDFQVELPLEQCFYDCFSPAKNETEGKYMSTAAIFKVLKSRFGSSLKISNIIALGRRLRNMDEIKCKRSKTGTLYLLKAIN